MPFPFAETVSLTLAQRAQLETLVGTRQLVRGHRPAGTALSGKRGRHTPALAHQLASARGISTPVNIWLTGPNGMGESRRAPSSKTPSREFATSSKMGRY